MENHRKQAEEIFRDLVPPGSSVELGGCRQGVLEVGNIKIRSFSGEDWAALQNFESEIRKDMIDKFASKPHFDDMLEMAYEDGMQRGQMPTELLLMPETTGRCPSCGTRYGYAFGTGDCGCEYEPEIGFG